MSDRTLLMQNYSFGDTEEFRVDGEPRPVVGDRLTLKFLSEDKPPWEGVIKSVRPHGESVMVTCERIP